MEDGERARRDPEADVGEIWASESLKDLVRRVRRSHPSVRVDGDMPYTEVGTKTTNEARNGTNKTRSSAGGGGGGEEGAEGRKTRSNPKQHSAL